MNLPAALNKNVTANQSAVLGVLCNFQACAWQVHEAWNIDDGVERFLFWHPGQIPQNLWMNVWTVGTRDTSPEAMHEAGKNGGGGAPVGVSVVAP